MKVVFDTNVLISAFLTTTGPSQYILSRALRRHHVILSSYILREFQEKLTKKLAVPSPLVHQALEMLRTRARVIEPTSLPSVALKDKKDIPILGLAIFCEARYLITGDKELLELKKHGTCTIMRPREAMEFL